MPKLKAKPILSRLNLIGQIESGQRYGKYVTTDDWIQRGSSWFVMCRCDCGLVKPQSAYSLLRGKISKCMSCKISEENFIHGQNTQEHITYEYHNWQNLKTKKLLCEKWSKSFVDFFKDTGKRPEPGLILIKRNHSNVHSPLNSYWGHPRLRFYKNIKGVKHGSWTPLEMDFDKKYIMWLCQCDCGRKDHVLQCNLINGVSIKCKSCAMLNKNVKHGMSRSEVYRTYHAMKRRCLDPKNEDFLHYGGRGIKICDRWLESFENFSQDMGDRPKNHSIDRIDVNGDYCKENCRWATQKQQVDNRRNISNMQLEINSLKEQLKNIQ